jgi:glutathione S-transferase
MLRAFGTENHSSEFDWDQHYGKGFDVLHMSNAPRLFVSSDPVVNMRIALMLAYYGISYAKGSMSAPFNWKDGNPAAKDAPAIPESLPIKFVDNDAAKSVVQGDIAIMMYLDAIHGAGEPGEKTVAMPQPELARRVSRFQQALALLDKWRALIPERDDAEDSKPPSLKPLRRELAVWDGYAAEADFLAGTAISIADFAAWPVLQDMEQRVGPGVFDGVGSLKTYYETLKATDAAAKVMGLVVSPPSPSSSPPQPGASS